MKFGYSWPEVSEEKSFKIVDGRRRKTEPAYYKLTRSELKTMIGA